MGGDELLDPQPKAWAELCILTGDKFAPKVMHRKTLEEFVGAVIVALEQNGQRKDDAVDHLQRMIDSWVRRAS